MQTFHDIILGEISNILFISVLNSSLIGTGCREGETACFVSGLYQEKLEFTLTL